MFERDGGDLLRTGGVSENGDRTKERNSPGNKIKVLAYPLGDFRYGYSLRVARCYGIALSLMRDIDWLFLSFRSRWEFKNLVCNFSSHLLPNEIKRNLNRGRCLLSTEGTSNFKCDKNLM